MINKLSPPPIFLIDRYKKWKANEYLKNKVLNIYVTINFNLSLKAYSIININLDFSFRFISLNI